MKNLFKIAIICVSACLSASCAGDYLDTHPTSSTGTATIFETTENAKYAVNGLCKIMTRQYLDTKGMNGEGTIKMWYGDYPGAHFYVNLSGWSGVINNEYLDNTSSKYCYYPWFYYYTLIGNANSILAYVDDAVESKAGDKLFIKAQALTFRAYSFMMLAQLYGYRWSDSNNGASAGVVLRTDLSDGDMPLSTLKETYQQIYDDLDSAISMYKESGQSRKSDDNYSPDIDVAYATYARAALNRQDYATAANYAALARKNYPLMSVNDYLNGFSTPNSEWIWSSHGSANENLHFYSFHAYIAYNSTSSNVSSYPKCISRELYNTIPATDIRTNLFLDPKKDSYTTTTGKAKAKSDLYNRAFAMHPDIDAGASIYAYMQFKFNAIDMPGVGHLNHFRSSEMYLIEAEAKYFQNDTEGAQKALIALTKDTGRDPEYTCTKTGEDLFNEIKKYRAIELWGEGFDWFDLKRWGDTRIRHTYDEGGNFLLALTTTLTPEKNNKWTWKIPLKESDYNGSIGGGSIEHE